MEEAERLSRMRTAFKYWKRRKPPPNLNDVIDLHSASSSQHRDIVFPISVDERFADKICAKRFGLIAPKLWKAYAVSYNCGLVYVKNPFSRLGQRYWTVRCLRDYTDKPHKLNIDAHGYLNENEHWWELVCSQDASRSERLVESLRWATLGYHHDWDTKVYLEENHNEFPADLGEMCKSVTLAFGFENFLPQASIVNYYHMNSTLAPHTDHSEKNLEAPLVSISFGQSAIFLLEGENGNPTAMYLHSGDIIIMSKKSRLSYHGVPKIIEAAKRPWRDSDDEENDELYPMENLNDAKFWKPYEKYVDSNRININVRQVLFDNQNTLNDVR